MGWDERQHKLLQAMGVRLWSAVAEPAPEVALASEPEPEVPVPEVSVPVPVVRVPAPLTAPEPVALAKPVQHFAGPIASMDWPTLQAAVAGCTACTLCRSRTQTVFGVGHRQAHWMIVGEAPGEEEDRQGEPFVGKSGQLLDNMLAAIGLSRAGDDPARQVYIANVLKCRPPANRNPQPDEAAQCEPYLRRQIELVQPRIILAMGRFAVNSLLQSDAAIGKLRGRVHQVGGVPTVVTYHPAYLLRNLADKAKAWDDLCLARATLTLT